MKKKRILSIFGTRPEATKMAPLITVLNKDERFDSKVCVTAQHREMLDQVLELFRITPDYDLNIMQSGQSLSDITCRGLKGLESVIKEAKPNLVLVHGDTTTTFAGSLASFYNSVPLGHVEAGLRTYDKFQPYPEEMNRKLTCAIADLNFAPTVTSKDNLLKENVPPQSIYITGNTAVDCLKTTVLENYRFCLGLLNELDYNNKKVIAMTAHRRENLGNPLENICHAVKKIVEDHEDVILIYAVHLNPTVQEIAHNILGGHSRIHLIDPIPMNDMHNLINKSFLVLTDSGGLQEEAPGLHKPVLVLRNVTERPEGLSAGTLKLVGTETENIYKETAILLNDEEAYAKMASAKNPFGDGYASERIVEGIAHYFGLQEQRPEDFS